MVVVREVVEISTRHFFKVNRSGQENETTAHAAGQWDLCAFHHTTLDKKKKKPSPTFAARRMLFHRAISYAR